MAFTSLPPPCKGNPGVTSDNRVLRKMHVAQKAEKRERPGSSEEGVEVHWRHEGPDLLIGQGYGGESRF